MFSAPLPPLLRAVASERGREAPAVLSAEPKVEPELELEPEKQEPEKPEPEKPETPGKSGKLETPETPGNPAKEVGGFVFKFCFLIVCASEPTFAFWKQACASMADARTATTWSYC